MFYDVVDAPPRHASRSSARRRRPERRCWPLAARESTSRGGGPGPFCLPVVLYYRRVTSIGVTPTGLYVRSGGVGVRHLRVAFDVRKNRAISCREFCDLVSLSEEKSCDTKGFSRRGWFELRNKAPSTWRRVHTTRHPESWFLEHAYMRARGAVGPHHLRDASMGSSPIADPHAACTSDTNASGRADVFLTASERRTTQTGESDQTRKVEWSMLYALEQSGCTSGGERR